MKNICLNLCSALLLTSTSFCTVAQAPDTILLNGKILTVDDDFSVAEAIAVSGERISAVGSSSEIRSLAGEDTEIMDLEGATVIPGLIDNHFHFLRAVQRWHRQPRLDGINSRRMALRILADKAAELAPGEWVLTQGGWYPEQFADEPGGFTLKELDRVAPENPLFLQERYNMVYANTLALEAVGIDPAEGARHQAQGLATFQPPYGSLIQQIAPTPEAQLEANLDDFMHTLNSHGLTALYSLGRGPEGEDYVLEERAEAGPLPLRIWHTLTYEANDADSADAAVDLISNNTPNTFDGDYGRFGLGEHIYLPFFDFPSQQGPWPDEVIDNLMKIATAAAQGDWHIHEHTMSNWSVMDLLDRFETLNETVPMDDLRWTLAHVYDITPDSIARAKKLGMTLAVHGVGMNGGVRIPFRDIAESDIIFGLGTDATVVSHYQPFITLGWAVSGIDIAGNKALDQTLTREEALVAHTRNNAWLFFQENNMGSLETGKYADLVVLDRDYMTVPADEIFWIQPTMTMVGGRVVYEAD